MIKLHSIAKHVRALAAFLPNGRTFEAKNLEGSNLHQLLTGISGEFRRVEDTLVTLDREYIPGYAGVYVEDWERAVGIPDECFDTAGTLEQRATNVVVKLASLGAQTAEDFIAIAELFGVTIEITTGTEAATFPMAFPVLLTNTAAEARATMIVTFVSVDAPVFPLVFPIKFGDEGSKTVECLLRRLAPDDVKLVFHYKEP